MFNDCEDPLCSVHQDTGDRFAHWPRPQPPPGDPVADLGEWVTALLSSRGGATAVTADGGIAEWSGTGTAPGPRPRGAPRDAPDARLRWWRDADGTSVLASRSSAGQLAVAEPGRLVVYHAAGVPAGDLPIPGRPSALVWQPEGELVVAAYERTLVAVDRSGAERARCRHLPSLASAIVFDQPRLRIGAVVRKGVVWFDHRLEPATFDAVLWDDGLRGAACSPDSAWMAISCYGGTTLLWGEGGSGANRSTSGPPGAGEVLAWSPDGRLLAVGHDGYVAVHSMPAPVPALTTVGRSAVEGAGAADAADAAGNWLGSTEPMATPGLLPAPAVVPIYLPVPARASAVCWVEVGVGDEPGAHLVAGCGEELVAWAVSDGLPSAVPRRRWSFGSPVTAIAPPGDPTAGPAGATLLVGLGSGELYRL